LYQSGFSQFNKGFANRLAGNIKTRGNFFLRQERPRCDGTGDNVLTQGAVNLLIYRHITEKFKGVCHGQNLSSESGEDNTNMSFLRILRLLAQGFIKLLGINMLAAIEFFIGRWRNPQQLAKNPTKIGHVVKPRLPGNIRNIAGITQQ
jgi:hypothetical protein